MKFTFLGDVHGDISYCRRVAQTSPDRTILQVGDLGVGTPYSNGGVFDEHALIGGSFIPPKYIETLPSNFYFFVGNHDCRNEAVKLKNCIGHFGEFNGLFFVSGADSYDKGSRTVGISWWDNEELSYEQCEQAYEAWKKSSCDVIVAHDLPQYVMQFAYPYKEKSRTRQLLESMITFRRPKFFIYGHHHRSMRYDFDTVKYIGLGIGETFELDTEETISLI